MIVDVLKVKVKPTFRHLAVVIVRYYDLTMKCELVLYCQNNKPWIRMPELWVHPDDKVMFCHWDHKHHSDQFQDEVLKQLKDRFGLSTERIVEIYNEAKTARNKSRKK